ncbi:MAG: hypothetical protein DDT25_00391 [Chloroflexi bacterium]|nr:hypothetical protein [Chloroflexota bacterium]
MCQNSRHKPSEIGIQYKGYGNYNHRQADYSSCHLEDKDYANSPHHQVHGCWQSKTGYYVVHEYHNVGADKNA